MIVQPPSNSPPERLGGKAGVCAITMVKDDYFFLEKWIEYYKGQVGLSNLVVISHGLDPVVAEIARDVAVIPAPQRLNDSIGHQRFELDRFNLVNNLCNGLVRYHDAVLFVDVDEFVVVDPRLGQTISEYVASLPGVSTFTCLGLDVFQKRSASPGPIRAHEPVLSQRFAAKVEPLYSKPVITRKEVVRSVGNHNANDPVLFVGPDLYLFHLKWMDRGLSMNMHFNRFAARSNARYERGDDLVDAGHDFPLRSKIDGIFDGFDRLPPSLDNFVFDRERAQYQRSWRRRRFLLQKGFYKGLFSKGAPPFSLHWRFDLTRSNEYHEIPERFRHVL